MARQLGCPLSVSSARRGAAVLLFSLGSSIYGLGFQLFSFDFLVRHLFLLRLAVLLVESRSYFLVFSVWIGKLHGRVPGGDGRGVLSC